TDDHSTDDDHEGFFVEEESCGSCEEKGGYVARDEIVDEECCYEKSCNVNGDLSENKGRYWDTWSDSDFISPWDFFTDPHVEIHTYVMAAGVDGVFTDYPATASRYRRNKCLSLSDEQVPNYARPAEPGRLFEPMTPTLMPPARAPSPVLNDSDLASPPIPPNHRETTSISTFW
nr:glycerophosphodiester phosphodiesterase GDPDL3-like [Tanacetum cinerariifolium]